MMGYTTFFYGAFELNKKLHPKLQDFLEKLNKTRRMKRDLPEEIYGVEGEFYVDDEKEDSIIDVNKPPSSQPSLWCQWKPTLDGKYIEWDNGEKFYNYVEWIKYIIDKILAPNGYILNGEVEWDGEESDDKGKIVIRDNSVRIVGWKWEEKEIEV